ncbi:unnamed protein product [Amoebophrya sp. A120]|nr:unnamed protein product [Amoebophrya sp. A120]|eukprot:GSA120T00001441001.1
MHGGTIRKSKLTYQYQQLRQILHVLACADSSRTRMSSKQACFSFLFESFRYNSASAVVWVSNEQNGSDFLC